MHFDEMHQCSSAHAVRCTNLIFDYSGVGYRPMPADGSVESTLIHFRHGELGNWDEWKKRLVDFLKRTFSLVISLLTRLLLESRFSGTR